MKRINILLRMTMIFSIKSMLQIFYQKIKTYIYNDIIRANSQYVEIQDNINLGISSFEDSLREAYTLAKCRKYISSNGYFGQLLVPFLRYYFNNQ